MNSFCVGLIAVLTVFAGTVSSKASNDQFYEMFKARAPMKEILAAVFDNCPTVQFQHLQAIQQHIENDDEYAQYATELKTAAQRILDDQLKQIDHKSINIEEYMKAANDFVSGVPVQNPDLESVVKEFVEKQHKLMEASEEEKQSSLEQLARIASTNDSDNVQNSES